MTKDDILRVFRMRYASPKVPSWAPWRTWGPEPVITPTLEEPFFPRERKDVGVFVERWPSGDSVCVAVRLPNGDFRAESILWHGSRVRIHSARGVGPFLSVVLSLEGAGHEPLTTIDLRRFGLLA